MTSTDQVSAGTDAAASRSTNRLPRHERAFDDLIDRCLRAYQRRVLVADHPGQTLNALRVVDQEIDRDIQAAHLYGEPLRRLLDERLSTALPGQKASIVFMRTALAVQGATPVDELITLIRRGVLDQQRAVHDALRFFPVLPGMLSDHTQHIEALLQATPRYPELLPLALQLVGERDVKKALPFAQAQTQELEAPGWAHYALACLGQAKAATREYAELGLSSGNSLLIDDALRIYAVHPGLAQHEWLSLAPRIGSRQHGIAWALSALSQPRATHDQITQFSSDALPDDIAHRLLAITGYVDGLIRFCHTACAMDGPLTADQSDVVLMVLGQLPLQARCQPNDPAAKHQSLRQLFIEVCRQSHIALRNDADIAAWEIEQLLANPAQDGMIRLREGHRFNPSPDAVPPLTANLMQVTHALRQWLYVERAYHGQHPLALSAWDTSRRQDLALMIASTADELRTH